MEKPIINNPIFKWYYGLPFARMLNKGARDYYKDRDRYESQFLLDSEKIRKNQELTINGVSALLILIITTLWTTLPTAIPNWYPITEGWLKWMKLGMENVNWKTNWGGAIWLLIIPGISGWGIHKVPYLIPQKKARLIINIIIKIIPVVILIICTYLVFTEKKFWEYRKYEKTLIKQKLEETIQKNQP